ncbi:PP2C family protein-serine/threonine phosphatase [Actinoallomurus rhizosphaericola]|uniref:PP2C family protein-serine/threonine phosphatase n=1 Tax=Actinoallomurus rhizosphaericola TaxID=2952536 RepID=UPI0020922C7F|nr:PP2C family protein-serine/threonine phosphatase [Actinoallomurus rhizosphaericola]MCO5998839.1 serine/threonine-protein phosphatase [Actinoallomurus rhizosphaericola]
MAFAAAFILTLLTVDLATSFRVRLSDILFVEAVVATWFSGPRAAGINWTLAAAACAVITLTKGVLTHLTELTALIMVAVFTTAMCYVRDRRLRELNQVKTIAEVAQRAVLRPLPRQVGPLRLSSLYLAAEDEAQIGGDLYAVTRAHGKTRLIIGDVRGKGLAAVGDAAALIGAFRGAAAQRDGLSELADFLEGSVRSQQAEPADPRTLGETFITAVLVEIPDDDPVLRLVAFGHPPPLRLHEKAVSALEVSEPAPPLGLGELMDSGYRVETFAFETGDVLLLHTDGVIEARDSSGGFFPLNERITGWIEDRPAALIDHLHADLLAYVGGRLTDDAAILAIERTGRRTTADLGDQVRRPSPSSPAP